MGRGRPVRRIRAAWQAIKDAWAEAFVYGDRGAARTSLGYAWTYLKGEPWRWDG